MAKYVDAYEYAGLEGVIASFSSTMSDTDQGRDAAGDAAFEFLDSVIATDDAWMQDGGIIEGLVFEPLDKMTTPEFRPEPGLQTALLLVDELLNIEGDEPALGHRYSLNQLLSGVLSESQVLEIAKDIATIEHWRGVYVPYVSREEELLDKKTAMICVLEPAVNGHRIADGFHRLAAAKVAGLRQIAAKLSPMFHRNY